MCKQSAVGQRLQHLCSYSTYKHASDDEEGANRGQGLKREHRESDRIMFFFRLCRGLMDFMYCKIKEQELTSLFDSFLV